MMIAVTTVVQPPIHSPNFHQGEHTYTAAPVGAAGHDAKTLSEQAVPRIERGVLWSSVWR